MEKTTLLILAIALTCLIVDESLGIATSLHGTRIRALPTEKSYKRRLKNRIAAWTANQWTGARRVRRIRRRKGKSKVSKTQLKISFSSIFFVVVQFNLLACVELKSPKSFSACCLQIMGWKKNSRGNCNCLLSNQFLDVQAKIGRAHV